MSGAIQKIERIQNVAELHLKGWKDTAIARKLNINVVTVKSDIAEWEEYIQDKAVKNPDILDKHLENTLKFDESFATIEKEAWQVVEDATNAGVVGHRLQALKLALEVGERRAKLHQLLGPKMERGYMNELKKAERINQELSRIIRETIADCGHCKPILWKKLEELFTYGGSLADEEPEDEENFEVQALPPGDDINE